MKFLVILSAVDPSGGDNLEGGARSSTSSPELFLRDSPGDFLSIFLFDVFKLCQVVFVFTCFVLSRCYLCQLHVDNRLV